MRDKDKILKEMKPEEVIEVLNEILDILGLSHCSNLSECIAVDKAVQALEKQKPMKVTSPRGAYPNEYGVTMYDYNCPNCGISIEFESLGCYEPEYCDECGQKLDWEEANERNTIQR